MWKERKPKINPKIDEWKRDYLKWIHVTYIIYSTLALLPGSVYCCLKMCVRALPQTRYVLCTTTILKENIEEFCERYIEPIKLNLFTGKHVVFDCIQLTNGCVIMIIIVFHELNGNVCGYDWNRKGLPFAMLRMTLWI